jgi:hypothetical protein
MNTLVSTPTSHRESDTTYVGVQIQINDEWRIVQCKDSVQYILQSARPAKGDLIWVSKGFYRTSAGLIDRVTNRAPVGEVSQITLDEIRHLRDL